MAKTCATIGWRIGLLPSCRHLTVAVNQCKVDSILSNQNKVLYRKPQPVSFRPIVRPDSKNNKKSKQCLLTLKVTLND